MNKKRTIVVLSFILLFLSLFMIFDFAKKNRSSKENVSKNILSITQPVTSVSGFVKNINKNKFTIVLNQGIINNTQSSKISTSSVEYQVIVSDKTHIYQPQTPITYLYKTASQSPQPVLSLKNVVVGQYITVTSRSDMRTLSTDTFEAVTINLPPLLNTINGKITYMDENTIKIVAFPPVSAFVSQKYTNKEKEYVISITPDTEISHLISRAEQGTLVSLPEKLSKSDLKKNMWIIVYTNEDVTLETNLVASRIEPTLSIINESLLEPTSLPTEIPSLTPATK